MPQACLVAFTECWINCSRLVPSEGVDSTLSFCRFTARRSERASHDTSSTNTGQLRLILHPIPFSVPAVPASAWHRASAAIAWRRKLFEGPPRSLSSVSVTRRNRDERLPHNRRRNAGCFITSLRTARSEHCLPLLPGLSKLIIWVAAQSPSGSCKHLSRNCGGGIACLGSRRTPRASMAARCTATETSSRPSMTSRHGLFRSVSSFDPAIIGEAGKCLGVSRIGTRLLASEVQAVSKMRH